MRTEKTDVRLGRAIEATVKSFRLCIWATRRSKGILSSRGQSHTYALER